MKIDARMHKSVLEALVKSKNCVCLLVPYDRFGDPTKLRKLHQEVTQEVKRTLDSSAKEQKDVLIVIDKN